MITRRRFLGASVAAGLGVGVYTWRLEPHWVQVLERRLPIANLPPELSGRRIVQLSDLHIGPRVDDSYLRRTFQRVQELAPEIVAYTGDFTSHEADGLAHVKKMFPHLARGSYATVAILGNHDYGPRWAHPETADAIADLAADVGVRVLRNEIADVRGLQIVGVDDLWGSRFNLRRALSNLQPDQPSLVLSHNPDSVDEPGWGDYAGWILSGHTHGGQCKPPFLPAPLLPVKNRRYQAGEYPLSGGRQLYINREQLHYTFQRPTEIPRTPPRELLARQAHVLESEAKDLEALAERVIRGDKRLRDAIREFANRAEHFYEVVEKGADSQHLQKDFQEVDDAWHPVVDRVNSSHYVYYLRNAAQNVNRVHNQIHELVLGGHGHDHDEKTAPVKPVPTPPAPPPPAPPRRRPAIEFEIPGIGRFQIPQ